MLFARIAPFSLDICRSIWLLAYVIGVLSEIDRAIPTIEGLAIKCPNPQYKIRVFSTSPLMLYIENFVSKSEASELISQAKTSFGPALIHNAEDSTVDVDLTLRIADTTAVESSFVSDCIAQRAAAVQGVSTTRLERIQIVRYETNGYFHKHTDWYGDSCTHDWCKDSGDRKTSFFVYLEANCEGGETEFHEIFLPEEMREAWCDVVNCKRAAENTLRWRPIAGNAIFWENLDSEGRGLDKMVHAGLPVTSGTKIGLNIWTRERNAGIYL